MIKKDKVQEIKKILYGFEDALSDGYRYYAIDENAVDKLLETIALCIIKRVEEEEDEESYIRDWRIS